METVDWPDRPTQVVPEHFHLTRAHLGKLPYQAHLTVEFLTNGLPLKENAIQAKFRISQSQRFNYEKAQECQIITTRKYLCNRIHTYQIK